MIFRNVPNPFILEDISHRWFSKSMRYRHCHLRCERENRVGEKSRGDDAYRRSHHRSGVLSIFEKKKKKRKQIESPAPERCERHSLTGVT